MKNVYDEVRLFYEEDIEWEPIIKREWVEGFLRQKAWQGSPDNELRNSWHNIQMLIIYLIHSDADCLDELTPKEYSAAIEWLSGHIPDYSVSIESVKYFFEVLKEFYKYLHSKKYIIGIDEITRAADEIAGGNQLKLLNEDSGEEIGLFSDNFDAALLMTDELDRKVGETVERLMVKIGTYFQQEEFIDDFDRALYLYSGPFEHTNDDEQSDFWLGFWDYFLFDYHLITTDEKPLKHFSINQNGNITSDERQIVEDLLKAKFTVFYINRVLGPDWVECIDLFTGETLELPYPDFEFNVLKKILFYGHLYSNGVVMLNYITTVEVSPNLRKRIKDEVLRQKLIYEIQSPNSTMEDFFDRHALVVRHTIDVLITLAKVNVTSAFQIQKEFPEIKETCLPNQQVAELLVSLAHDYGFSLHDTNLIKKLWYDYSQLTSVTLRKPGTWAAAVIFAYAQINGTNDIDPDELADSVGVSASSVKNNRNKLFDILQLQKFDPRYLSEEGFILSLFVL
ncbi:hypothetical protein [Dendrosporobacter sp. 1207_IL3150]|uniref:hypothetical protein n=1 Tax=Dendrosporobacter sp. 1207_IL3150 TaxID=3084054 RepID=UPI002FDA2C59